jgi:competence protein ComEC
MHAATTPEEASMINWQRFMLMFGALLLCAATGSAQARVHYINVGQADAILIELPRAAVLIDAGGEDTVDNRDGEHISSYLETFFRHRPDLNRTLHTVIVSHPHIDHTRLLFDVVRTFSVRNLIDGGNTSGSGIAPLQQARDFVRTHGGNLITVLDQGIGSAGATNAAFDALHAADPNVSFRILSGSRGCANANNDSLVVRLQVGAAKFIFTGDAESEDDARCTSELSLLLQRYRNTPALDVDVYKVGHHGSHNGTTAAWMQALSPRISVISAGVPSVATPGEFHAFFFGHPREDAVAVIEAGTGGARAEGVMVETMDAVQRVHHSRVITREVYCTCWEGDVVVRANADGSVVKEGQCSR